MGNRRMFSNKIISSARFLKMPIDSQNLYFHLGMHADDDGIVEAYTIMRSVGSSEDNLRVLAAKGMVRVLNEDFVTYILDWNEHNLIRADRKVDSIYKNLLLQIVPEADIMDPKPRSDVKDNTLRLGGLSTDGLSKDKLSKDKLSKDNNIAGKPAGDEINATIALFEPINPSYEKLFANTTQRSAVKRMLKKHGYEALSAMVNSLPAVNKMPYMPATTTPLQLEDNIGKIKAKAEQARATNKPKNQVSKL